MEYIVRLFILLAMLASRAEGVTPPSEPVIQAEGTTDRLVELRTWIDQEEVALDEMEAALDALEDQMLAIEAEANPLKDEIDAIEAAYDGEEAPDDVYEDYQAKIERHNVLVDAHWDLLNQYNLLRQPFLDRLATFNERIDEFNRLND